MRKIIQKRMTQLSNPVELSADCPLWNTFHEFRLKILRRNALRRSAVFFDSERKKSGRRASDQ
jgi:hypothetical protein